MNKFQYRAQINACLRKALNRYYSSSGITQEKLAEKLNVSSKACWDLLNGKYGFSAFSAILLFLLLPIPESFFLFKEVCTIILITNEEIAQKRRRRMKGCTCESQRQMIAERLEFQKNHADSECSWASPLFESDPDDSLCCLLTFLFDCAYCKKCTVPLGEVALAVVKSLTKPTE